MWHRKLNLSMLGALVVAVVLVAAMACGSSAEPAAAPAAPAAAAAPAAPKAPEAPAAPAAASAAAPAEAAAAAAAAATGSSATAASPGAAKAPEAPKAAAPAASAAPAAAAAAAASGAGAAVRTSGTATGEWQAGQPRVAGGYVPPKRVQGVIYTYEYDESLPRPTSWSENPLYTEMAVSGEPYYTPKPILKGVEADPFPILAFADRVPKEDHRLVLDVYDEIGLYGGTWRMGSAGWMLDIAQFSKGECVTRQADERYAPYMCESWVQSADGRDNVFGLREGMKWADGAPLVMANVSYGWDDIMFNPEFKAGVAWRYKDPVSGEYPTYSVVDDWHFQLSYKNPFFNFIEGDRDRGPRCRVGCWYGHDDTKQFHATYADPAKLAALIETADVETWVDLFKMQTTAHGSGIRNVPHIGPYIQTKGLSVNVGTQYMANPYHPVFDPDGNQLPYVKDINVVPYESREVAVFRAMAGEHDLGSFIFSVEELPLYQANKDKGDYSMYMWTLGGSGGSIGNGFGHEYNEQPEIGKLMRSKDFHHAWSLAIDGEAINDTVVMGLGTVRGAMVTPISQFYPGDGWDVYSGYDPVKAGTILDGLGLVDTDGDGVRNFSGIPGGDTGNVKLFWEIPKGGHAGDRHVTFTTLMQENLADVGIQVDWVQHDNYSMGVRDLKSYLISGGAGFSQNYWQGNCISMIPGCNWSGIAPSVGNYISSDGAEGVGPTGPDPAYLPLAPAGAFPFDPSGKWDDVQAKYKEGFGYHLSDPRRTALGKEINTLGAENIWGLGYTAEGPTARWNLQMKRNNFRNVPKDHSSATLGLMNEVYYFEDGIDNQNNAGNRSKRYKSETFLTGLSYE